MVSPSTGNPFKNTMGTTTGRFSGYMNPDRLEETISDLTAVNLLEIMEVDLLPKLREAMEEARLRCEDEEDDTSLGEYIGMRTMVDYVEAYIKEVPNKTYSLGNRSNFGRLPHQYYTQQYSNVSNQTMARLTGNI